MARDARAGNSFARAHTTAAEASTEPTDHLQDRQQVRAPRPSSPLITMGLHARALPPRAGRRVPARCRGPSAPGGIRWTRATNQRRRVRRPRASYALTHRSSPTRAGTVARAALESCELTPSDRTASAAAARVTSRTTMRQRTTDRRALAQGDVCARARPGPPSRPCRPKQRLRVNGGVCCRTSRWSRAEGAARSVGDVGHGHARCRAASRPERRVVWATGTWSARVERSRGARARAAALAYLAHIRLIWPSVSG